uniref:Leucine-rich repeat extensin-like protein 3 n=1 Tax=Nicotiana sylvestris TaxID=4096 RepID=A0A1U7VMR6_NICSY|nr:PREDICTED: leucine-rich repeat extensin-like protein 3 [Nicotiana sylvestris]
MHTKFTWAFAFFLLIIVTLLPIATCHLPQCSFQGIDLEQCLDQGKSQASFDSCCNALNQVIQAGYYCLCAILGSSSPLITTSLVLPLSNCFISIPPLTQCQAPQAMFSPVQEMKPPPSRPVPIFLPPKEPPPSPLPSVPKDLVLPLPPNMDDIPVLNSTRDDKNNPSIQSPAILGSRPAPESKIPNKDENLTSFGGDNKKFLLYARVVFLLITVSTFYLMLIV